MWIQRGQQTMLVPDHMPDTIKRCLGDGWVEIPDPRQLDAAPVPASVGEPQNIPEPATPEPEPTNVRTLPVRTSAQVTRPNVRVRR